MKAVDTVAITEFGVPGIALMENAGRMAAVKCSDILEGLKRDEGRVKVQNAAIPAKVVIFAGKGSNGGDGFVVARYLHNWGYKTRVLLAAKCDDVKGDTCTNLEICRRLGVEIWEVPAWRPELREDIERFSAGASLFIDALLGTGSKGVPREPVSSIIQMINFLSSQKGIPVLAIDLPSGVDADDGSVPEYAVMASHTVTMGLLKRGLVLFPGAEYAGDIEVVDISLPEGAVSSAGIDMEVISPDTFRNHRAAESEAPAGIIKQSPYTLFSRQPDTHKGSYGHVLVVAGSRGFTGAASLTAMGALRTGAGLVTVACPQSVQDIVASKLTEVMTVPLPDEPDGVISPLASERVLSLADGKSVVAVGPGLGRTETVRSLINALLEHCKAPLVIDADGLSVLEENISWVKSAVRTSGFLPVLTPHPGEMGRLLGKSSAEVQRDRAGCVNALAKTGECVSVLKGARTLVSDSQVTYVNLTGNPGMASGGMGDVLTGMIAGFISQGASPLMGALLGVYLHGKAGDKASFRVGENALLAGDLLDSIGPEIVELAKWRWGEFHESDQKRNEIRFTIPRARHLGR